MRPRVVSSRKSVASRKLPPEPPYASGICRPYQPSSPIRRATSSEWPSSSGTSNFSRAAKSRMASTKATCSSLRPGFTPLPYRCAAGRAGGLRRLPGLETVQLPQRDHHLVHLVRPVGDPQPAALAPHRRERNVVGHPESAVHLHRAVEHLLVHLRRHDLDHRDLLARRPLALGVHLPGRV